jgi:trigger factor
VIERFREATAKFVDVADRASQSGDFVNVDLVGKYLDPKEPYEEEGLKSEGVVIELDGEGVQAEFSEALTGLNVGDVKEFRVVYPEDFTSAGLSGKTLDFTATVKQVQVKELPELNDEFAKERGQAETVQEMRDKLRENMVRVAEREAEAKLREDVIEKLLEDYDFAVPTVLIEDQTQNRLRRFAYQLMAHGVQEEYFAQLDWKEHTAEARVFSIRDIRAALVIGKIGEVENIDITDEEIDYEIAAIAHQEKKSFSEVKASLTKKGAISSIESQLHYNKSLDWLVANAQVTVEEVTSEQLEQRNAKTNSSTLSPEPTSTAAAE